MEEQQWYYLTHSWRNKKVHTFPGGISPKVNLMTWLEFEPAYFVVIAQHITYYTTGTLGIIFFFCLFNGMSTSKDNLMPKWESITAILLQRGFDQPIIIIFLLVWLNLNKTALEENPFC